MPYMWRKKDLSVTIPVRGACTTKNTERKKTNKPKQTPVEADKQREHSMTKHWAHRPHPLGQHFVFQEKSIYLAFCPIPSISFHRPSPPKPTPQPPPRHQPVQQYRILHILCWHAGQWHRYATHTTICLIKPALLWKFPQLFESKKASYIIW